MNDNQDRSQSTLCNDDNSNSNNSNSNNNNGITKD